MLSSLRSGVGGDPIALRGFLVLRWPATGEVTLTGLEFASTALDRVPQAVQRASNLGPGRDNVHRIELDGAFSSSGETPSHAATAWNRSRAAR
jgi:hypothetical protein